MITDKLIKGGFYHSPPESSYQLPELIYVMNQTGLQGNPRGIYATFFNINGIDTFRLLRIKSEVGNIRSIDPERKEIEFIKSPIIKHVDAWRKDERSPIMEDWMGEVKEIIKSIDFSKTPSFKNYFE